MDAEGHHTTLGARAGQICRGFWFLLIILFLQWIPYDERAFCENLGEHSHHLLAGTNIRDTGETCAEQHYKQHIIFGSTGEPPRGRQNTSGGVSIILRSRVFQRKNVSRVYSPPQALQGRFGAVRLRRGDLDVCAITVYMHTEPQKQTQQERNLRLWRYVENFISKLPHRCVPLLCLDANAHVGFRQGPGQEWRVVQSTAIGPFFPEPQNYNGGMLLSLLENQYMAATNTFL